jgi:nucleoside-diphosphate-sugar epimerase
MMKKILVTGATGFIGYEVSKLLCLQGFQPRLMVRRPIRGMLLKSLDAELKQGDLSRPQSIQRLVAGVDTVIHLGAMATFESYRKVRSSIVDGSVNLMRAAIDAGVEHFVYGGSLLVYGDQTKPISRDTRPQPQSGYGRAKLEAENLMAEMADKAGIHFISIRLPHVYGAKSLLFYQIRQGTIFFPGKGNNLFGHLHVSDAARALIKAAVSDKHGVYVVADNLSCSWNDLFEITQSFYPKLRVLHIPKWFALMATGIIELLLKYKQTPNRFSTGAVLSWNLHLPVESNTLTTVLDIEPEYSTISDGIPEVLDDCIAFTWRPSNLDN